MARTHWINCLKINRIYPLYFLLTSLTFLIYQLDASYDLLGLWQSYKTVDKLFVGILNFTFLRGFFAHYFFSGISQGWSLTVEETFYIFAPFILLSIAGKFRRLGMWTIGLLSVGFALVLLCAPFSEQTRGFFASSEFMMQWTFFGHSLEFSSGIALAIFVARQGSQTRPGVMATYGGMLWILGCAAFVATMEYMDGPLTGEHLKTLTINFLLPTGICLLFYGLLRERSSLRRRLETRTFDLLGKSAYAFYLSHACVLSVALTRAGSHGFLSLGVSVLVSMMLFKFIKEPLHKRLKVKRLVVPV